MLRFDILQGTKQVLAILEKSAIISAMRNRGKDGPATLLRSLREYSIAASSFSNAARTVVQIFGIEKLEDPDFWLKLLSEQTEESAMMHSRLRFMIRELPALLSLLEQDTVNVAVAKAESESSRLGSIQIRLIEKEGSFSTAERVIEALSACKELYDSLAALEGDVSEPLAIGAVDSGSDKSFDLFGAAKVMSELRHLILSIWDLVVFHRERKIGKQLELIAAALPILERIKKLEDGEKLGREQAQIIRNGIIDGTKKFLDAGITTAEINDRQGLDPRQLLAPEPKLLAAPDIPSLRRADSDVPPSGEDPTPRRARPGKRVGGQPSTTSNLSEDDIRRIADEVRRASNASVRGGSKGDDDADGEGEGEGEGDGEVN